MSLFNDDWLKESEEEKNNWPPPPPPPTPTPSGFDELLNSSLLAKWARSFLERLATRYSQEMVLQGLGLESTVLLPCHVTYG